MSNRDGTPRRLEPGHYALGNLLLDSDDVQPAKQRVAQTLTAVEPLFAALGEAKIVDTRYGTRCSTVYLDAGTERRYAERGFSPDGTESATRHFSF